MVELQLDHEHRQDIFVPKYHWFSPRRKIAAQPITFERACNNVFSRFSETCSPFSTRQPDRKVPTFPPRFFSGKNSVRNSRKVAVHISPQRFYGQRNAARKLASAVAIFFHIHGNFFTSEKGRKKSERAHFRHFSRKEVCERRRERAKGDETRTKCPLPHEEGD